MPDSLEAKNKTKLQQYLWNAIDELRNFGLRPSEYSESILGLIFLYYLELKFKENEKSDVNLEASKGAIKQGNSQIKRGIQLPDKSCFSKLLHLSSEENIGEAINKTMSAIESQNQELSNVLPKNYNFLDNALLSKLIENLSSVGIEEDDITDVKEVIYESMLEKITAEGRAGNDFFTPRSLIKLMVESAESFRGGIYDSLCGSNGMLIEPAKFSKSTYRIQRFEAERKRSQLENCPYGREVFSQYENIGTAILEYIFSSELERVKTQATTKDGTQRRDVIFKNKETSPFWQRIARKYSADFITVDFKNYQDPITSEVVESVTKYANKQVGNFIIIVSRKGISKSAVETQLRILRNRDIVIIVISDENLIQMLDLKESDRQPEKILEDLLVNLIISY